MLTKKKEREKSEERIITKPKPFSVMTNARCFCARI